MTEGAAPRQHGWVPIPDPTSLTAAAVDQAKEDLRREIAGLRELLETRIEAMSEEMHQTWARHEGDIRLEQVEREALREVVFEKFHERDLRFTQKDKARQSAVDAAIATGRELAETKMLASQAASDKFQEAVLRQIETQGSLNTEARERLADQIRGLEQRLDRGEGVKQGTIETELARQREHERESRSASNRLLLLGVAVSVVVIMVNIVLFALSHR